MRARRSLGEGDVSPFVGRKLAPGFADPADLEGSLVVGGAGSGNMGLLLLEGNAG